MRLIAQSDLGWRLPLPAIGPHDRIRPCATGIEDIHLPPEKPTRFKAEHDVSACSITPVGRLTNRFALFKRCHPAAKRKDDSVVE